MACVVARARAMSGESMRGAVVARARGGVGAGGVLLGELEVTDFRTGISGEGGQSGGGGAGAGEGLLVSSRSMIFERVALEEGGNPRSVATGAGGRVLVNRGSMRSERVALEEGGKPRNMVATGAGVRVLVKRRSTISAPVVAEEGGKPRIVAARVAVRLLSRSGSLTSERVARTERREWQLSAERVPCAAPLARLAPGGSACTQQPGQRAGTV